MGPTPINGHKKKGFIGVNESQDEPGYWLGVRS